MTQGTSSSLLPDALGLSVNVPVGAHADNYAFTNIDAATDANLSVLGNSNFAHYSFGAPISGSDPHSEGNAFNAGKITVSPIDGSIAVHDSDAYDFLASLIGTSFGDPTAAPVIAGDLAIGVNHGGTTVVTVADLDEADPDSSGAALTYTVTATSHGEVLVKGSAVGSFTQEQLAAGDVSFHHDCSQTDAASFSVRLADGSGLTAAATVNATVAPEPGKTIVGTNGKDSLTGTAGNDIIKGQGGADQIIAGGGDDRVFGGNGRDRIDGGPGNDHLTGGNGADTFVFHQGFGKDVITDFSHGDVIAFDHSLFGDFKEVKAALHQEGHNTVITVDASNSITLEHVLPQQLHWQDFMFV